LYNTLHAPTAVKNLLSIPHINDAGGSAEFQHSKANIKARNGQLILQGKKKSQLYWLENFCAVKAENQVNTGNAKEVDRNSWVSWHRRCGHISNSSLELLVKNQSIGLTIDPDSNSQEECESCIQAKMHRQLFPQKALRHSQEPGEDIHSDLWILHIHSQLRGTIITFHLLTIAATGSQFCSFKPKTRQRPRSWSTSSGWNSSMGISPSGSVWTSERNILMRSGNQLSQPKTLKFARLHLIKWSFRVDELHTCRVGESDVDGTEFTRQFVGVRCNTHCLYLKPVTNGSPTRMENTI
jgi:hypothetical protein